MKLVYGLVSPTATYWLHYVARACGYYSDEGIEVEDHFTGGTNAGVAALESGAVDVASNCPDRVVAAVARGASLAVVGGVVHRPVSSIVVAPGIGKLEELRGRRVAMSDEEGGVASLLRAILRRHGLAKGDYLPTVVGGTPDQAVALRDGRVAAGMLTHPFERQLEREGFRVLGAVADYWERYAFTTLNVRRDWARENRTTLEGLLRATTRAGRWLRDPANAREAQTLLAQVTGQPVADAAVTYERYVGHDDVLAWRAEVDEAGMGAVLELMREEGTLSVPLTRREIVEREYWERANPE